GRRPYPQFYLEVMLGCDAIWNEAHWCDDELDALITVAGTTLDEAERVAAYGEIQRILIERGPLLIPYFFPRLAAHRDDLQGFALKPFSGRTDFRGVRLAPSQ
ncbi:MAG: 4-phytase, partial [Chloroflexi bacterium]|nr:4-phytase [Chloroflexota bacterium]